LKKLFLIAILTTLAFAAKEPPTLQRAFYKYDNHKFVAAFHDFKKLAIKGNKKALIQIAYMTEAGEGTKKNIKESFSIFHKLALSGDGESMFQVAKCYETGKGVKENVYSAINWYEKSFESGFYYANFDLANLYLNGHSHIPANKSKAIKLLKAASDKDQPESQYKLSTFYAEGNFLPKNEKLSLKYLQLAAKNELPIALNNLGIRYYSGIGVPVDIIYAHELIMHAFNLGYTPAKNNLLMIYKKYPSLYN